MKNLNIPFIKSINLYVPLKFIYSKLKTTEEKSREIRLRKMKKMGKIINNMAM